MSSLIKLTPNCAEVEAGGIRVLFSYETPVGVAVGGLSPVYYVTAKHFSRTTGKHVAEWLKLNGVDRKRAHVVPQESIEAAARGDLRALTAGGK